MTSKNSIRVKYAAEEESEEGRSGLGSSQKETEKVVIPEDGEIHLKNSNIIPDSISVVNGKTGEEFSMSEDQSFGPGKYFFLPEEGTVFFSPSDAGLRVKISYLWKEESEDEEPEEDKDEDDEETVDSSDEEGKPRAKSAPADSMWHLDEEWFKWKPQVKKVTVNNSLQVKLEKGVDLHRGLKVHNENTGKELRVVLSGLDKSGKTKRSPAPGEVVYNYDNGSLYWGDSTASGNTYVIEYFLKGQKGTPVTMAGEENEEKEYNLLESFKSRSENLWTNLLDNPDPEFVSRTLIPTIEDEIEAAREKVMGLKSEPQKEEELKNFSDLTGEFMQLEHLLAKREEHDSEDTRQQVRDFIESDISPKLARYYSLASLLAERSYDMQSEAAKDEDFPEFGSSGARSLDLHTLKYLKKVRQEANNLDHDLVDFSKYYTGLLLQWILDPDTYYPVSPSSHKKRPGKKDPRLEGIKRVFESAGVGLADLQSVALEAFRRAILEFDREKRDKNAIPDPKKFRVFGNPLVKHRVVNALKRLFDKCQREQTVESTSRSGTTTVTIPAEGGEVDLGVPGLRLHDLQVKADDGELFTSSQGVLLPTEPEKRKSKLVKIVLGRRDPSAQISVTNPETGEKLTRVEGAWNADQKAKIASNPSLFQFNHSQGTIWISDHYRGKKLLVEAPGLSGESVVGKNQYRAHPTRGTLEFSAENGGQKVQVSYSQTIRAKRFVSPVSKNDEGEGETSLVDTKEDEGADAQSKAEEALSQEHVDKLLEVISDVLTVDEDPRLSTEDRAILEGLLGIGEPSGGRLTIQEIAARAPFNIDVSDSNKMNQMKVRRQKAANTLLEILKEKASEDPSLKKMLRPLETVLFSKDSGAVDTDKFLGFLNTDAENARSFQNVLTGLLGKAGLKQDEENILRWMWALPGNLRRDQDAEEKKYQALPGGLAPAKNPGERLQEIAIDEFGINADDEGKISPAATSVINKVYDRALNKFQGKFNTVYEGKKEFFQERFPEFVKYYDRQLGKQNLRDELTQIESPASLPPKKEKKAPEKKVPLYEQIQKSVKGVDEDMLHSLMEELLTNYKKGGSISDLIQTRQDDLDKVVEKGAKILDEKTKTSREALETIKDAVSETQAQLESIKEDLKDSLRERDQLRSQALTEADEATKNTLEKAEKGVKTLSEIYAALESGSIYDLLSPRALEEIEDPKERAQYEAYSYLRDAEGQDLDDAKKDLKSELDEKKTEVRELRKKAVSLAGAEVRKGLRQLKQRVEDLKSKNDKFRALLNKQETELDSKREDLKKATEPLQKKIETHLKNHNANKELQALQKVKKYLEDREDLQRGDGTIGLDNMFEVTKPEKGEGYKAPKLAPGEEETYQPLPREDEALPVVEKKPSGEPEPFVPGPSTKKIKPVSKEDQAERAERTKFAPKPKQAPSEIQTTLFDELRAVAVPLDPDESRRAYQERIENFRVLMKALQEHFAQGKSIKDFKPKFSASQTLPDQSRALKAVVEYLRDYGSDLKKGPGTWDLKNLFKHSVVKPVETLQKKKVDLSNSDAAIESLLNAQPTLANKGQAKALHELTRLVNKGTPLQKIVKGLKSSGNPNADNTLNLAMRLAYFMALHEDLKKDDGTWDFASLYSGESKFPSYEEFDRSRPIEDQVTPLIKSIQHSLQEEAGPGGGIESVSATQQRVLEMLHRMSELALHGKSLEDMEAIFAQDDKRGARPYSVAYLFQQVRNFLNRLNRTKGLANMSNDLGLSKVFGPGAPAGTPTERDEVKAPSKEEKAELLPTDDRTTTFRQMVSSTGMDEKEAAIAHKLVASLQLRMENGTKVAAELLSALVNSNPAFKPIVRKILTYIGANRTKFDSGVAGVPDLSALTGMPFKHPHAETSTEPEAPANEVPPLQEILKEKVEPASEDTRKELRKTIFDEFAKEHELDEEQKHLFADAIRRLKENSGKSGIEKLVSKTKGTQLEGVFELLAEFFREKNLVDSEGIPDFRGVAVPAQEGRDSFFKKDGTPNMDKVQEETPDFDADEMTAEMPEPKADLEEHADELVEDLGGRGTRFSPEMQEAVDFLKSDQVQETEEPARDTAKDRLKKNLWTMMVQEFDFDAEEQENAAAVLRAVQKSGLDRVKAKVKENHHLDVLLDDLIEYIKEQGLTASEIADMQLPPPKKGKPSGAKKLTPTTRKKVDVDVVLKTLEAAQKAQTDGVFDTAQLVKNLEGKVSPEDAKNALLQAMDEGLVTLQVETGKKALSGDVAKFAPIAPDGVALTSGRVVKLPVPEAAPQPAGTPKGKWRQDSATNKQLEKIHTLMEALKFLGGEIPPEITGEESMSKGQASDAINTLKAAIDAAKKKAPAPKAAPQAVPESPVKGKEPARVERMKLQKLMEKALDWSTKNEVTSAQGFKMLLNKAGRKDLIPLYEKIMPQVQKSLDAIHHGDLNFDLSDL